MSEDDPFENLDPPEDREGDPFENLGPPEDREGEDGGETDDGSAGRDTADGADDQPDAPPREPDDGAEDAFWDEMRDADQVAPDTTTATDPGPASEASDGTGPVSEPDADPTAGAGSDPTVPAGEPASESDPGDEEASDDAPDFEEAFVEGDTVGAGDGPAGLGDDDPFADLGERGGDPFGEGESVFEEVDVEELDVDELWELLESDEGTPSAVNHPVEVSKHRFCEQCEFFAGPPAAHCTNEEAEILEFIGMEQVRVIDCPIVAEQRRLENEE